MFDIADLSPNFVTSLFEHFDGDNEIIIPFDLNSHIYDFIEISILLKVMGKTGLSTFLVNDNILIALMLLISLKIRQHF